MHTSEAIGRTTTSRRRVAPLMLIALAALLTGMWAGLARIGWRLPAADSALMLRHGGLMVVGFVGTVIAVERAVAVQSLPAFLAPAFSASAGVALIAGAPPEAAPALAVASGLASAVNVGTLLLRHRTLPFVLLLAGSLCFAGAGAVWWHGGGIAMVVPWWMAFLVLTIASERLEILRFQHFSHLARLSGAVALILVLLGPLVTLADLNPGARVLGAGMLAEGAWLAQRDMARRTVRTDGLARFAAVGVLTAYAWLIASGVLLVSWGLVGVGLRYDAVLHAFFIGFVFGAIIAHEPIIAPTVTGLPFSYTPLLYVPLGLLDGGLMARIASDVWEIAELRRWAGLLQVVAILLFLAISAASVVIGRRQPRQPLRR